MQIGRRFHRYMIERLPPIDWAWVREQLVENDTRCEYPGCHEPACDAVRSDRLFAFVCQVHKIMHKVHPNQVHLILCVKMIEAMRVRVYKYQEALTGGNVAMKLADDLKAERIEKQREKAAVRNEPKLHRRAANGTPGAPDPTLIARQRTRLPDAKTQTEQPVELMPIADFF